MRSATYDLTISTARADALFASTLQRSDEPTVAQVHRVAGMFGMNFWNTEGLLTHSLHTVIIDRRGKLAANIDGNQFTAQQLGDLVKAVMNRPA